MAFTDKLLHNGKKLLERQSGNIFDFYLLNVLFAKS